MSATVKADKEFRQGVMKASMERGAAIEAYTHHYHDTIAEELGRSRYRYGGPRLACQLLPPHVSVDVREYCRPQDTPRRSKNGNLQVQLLANRSEEKPAEKTIETRTMMRIENKMSDKRTRKQIVRREATT